MSEEGKRGSEVERVGGGKIREGGRMRKWERMRKGGREKKGSKEGKRRKEMSNKVPEAQGSHISCYMFTALHELNSPSPQSLSCLLPAGSPGLGLGRTPEWSCHTAPLSCACRRGYCPSK